MKFNIESIFKKGENKELNPKSKEGNVENFEEKKVFFEDADQLLLAIQSIPDFTPESEDVKKYTQKAIEELEKDKEALKIFQETSERFNKIQKQVVDKISQETHMMEYERDNPYGDRIGRKKFRLGLYSVAALFNACAITDILQRGIKLDEAIAVHVATLVASGLAVSSDIAMTKHIKKENKKISSFNQSTNMKNKLECFLDYISIIGNKEKEGYSYNKELSKKLTDLKLTPGTLKGVIDISDTLIQNESVDLLHTLSIAGKYAKKIDNEEELKLFIRKLGTMNSSDRLEYELYFENILASLSENKSVDQVDSFEYKMLCKQVYPMGNYDTFKYLDQYKDRTGDLDKYKFNREGMDTYIDGMSGYKLREGVESNPEILSEYSKRLQKINSISDLETLTKFLEKETTTDAETLEGKLLAYIEQGEYSKDAFDVLIAYQLGEDYAQLIRRSQDQVTQFEDPQTKEYIQLAELADIYGDNLKETIKDIVKKIRGSKDAQLFEKVSSLSARQLSAGERMAEDLMKLPPQAQTDSVLQKKVETLFKNTFQGQSEILPMAKEFSLLFSAKDFSGDLATLWRSRLQESIVSQVGSMIDVSALQRMQNQAFLEIQNETQKYQELVEVDTTEQGTGEKKMKKLRHLKSYFSKNKENAHARMVAHVCLANDPKMLENPNYFELVIFDPERKRNMGTTMLLTMEEPNNKKYLLYNPNPSVGLVSEVSAKRLYKMITDQVIAFAKDNNFDGILVNPSHGSSTNRGGLFLQALQQSTIKENGTDRKINLSKEHVLSGGYKYKDNLSIIWEKGI